MSYKIKVTFTRILLFIPYLYLNQEIMGRKKINTESKKAKLSVTISIDNALKLDELKFTNKSKLINWLLKEHFNQEGGQDENK